MSCPVPGACTQRASLLGLGFHRAESGDKGWGELLVPRGGPRHTVEDTKQSRRRNPTQNDTRSESLQGHPLGACVEGVPAGTRTWGIYPQLLPFAPLYAWSAVSRGYLASLAREHPLPGTWKPSASGGHCGGHGHRTARAVRAAPPASSPPLPAALPAGSACPRCPGDPPASARRQGLPTSSGQETSQRASAEGQRVTLWGGM